MKRQEIEKTLKSTPVFAGLAPELIAALAEAAAPRALARGESLFRQGEKAEHFYLLQSGSVSIEIPAIAGPKLQVQRLGPGKVLGWSWLMPPYRWSFQAVAEEDSKVLEFDGKAILERCETDPAFGYPIVRHFSALMAERLDAAHQRMMDQWSPAGFA